MTTILKYHLLERKVVQTLHLKKGALVLHVGVLNHALYVWVILDSAAKGEDRTFEIHEEGAAITEPRNLRHVGSTLSTGEALMFHVFERLSPRA